MVEHEGQVAESSGDLSARDDTVSGCNTKSYEDSELLEDYALLPLGPVQQIIGFLFGLPKYLFTLERLKKSGV